MFYVFIGAIGFSLVHIFDFVALKKLPLLKPILWLSGSALLVYAGFMVCFNGNSFLLPVWLNAAGWAVFAAGIYFFLYSLFVNLPFGKTYVQTGVGDKLVTSGFYALVRHPGVPWFVLAMAGMTLGAGTDFALWAAVIWSLLDILLVYIQDRWVFGKMFPGYAQYQKTTPMLIPNRKSIAAYIKQRNFSNTIQGEAK
ncbi:methyltransferase family protein [Dehalococcoides mccartyi]|uniref:Methyltransferase n=1 Tax=Dehalococcoides mccartyi TaxID=61435 RepID=A0AB38Z8X0_9CHLR|nr:methyltransferase [Dehalococcoides mccartyi]OBW61446.1 MAG: hypothetical protein A9181_00115 [Dehalococcoides mccartyi]WRO07046.1 methyltransferase [Dehalococcoides mccartyi]